jgi:hypothetical protein
MTPDTPFPKLESERVYVVYDGRTGDIVHIHRVWTFSGGTSQAVEREEARALELAGQFGQRVDRLRVLRVPQRVDTKTGKLIAVEAPTLAPKRAKQRPGKRVRPKR